MSGSPADGNAGLAEPPMTEGLERAIRDLPGRVHATLSADLNQLGAATALAGGSRRIRLCGSGPDLNAAQAGEWLLRDIGVWALAQHSYDLAEFPTGFDPGDLIIGVDLLGDESVGRAIRLASDSGLNTLVITNRELTPYSPDATLPVETTDEGVLLASPTLPAALMAAITSRIEPGSTTAQSLSSLPDSLQEMDAARPVAREVADEIGSSRRRLVIGAVGPSLWAAASGAWLIRRATGLPVEVDHLQSLSSTSSILTGDDVLIEIAPENGGEDLVERVQSLVTSRNARHWRIGGGGRRLTWHTPVLHVGPTLMPFPALVALYWLAVELGTHTPAEPTAS